MLKIQKRHGKNAGLLGGLLAALVRAGEQHGMPYLAHADMAPATCLLFTLQLAERRPQAAVAAASHDALIGRLRARVSLDADDGTARQVMLAQLFSTTLDLLKVRCASGVALPSWAPEF